MIVYCWKEGNVPFYIGIGKKERRSKDKRKRNPYCLNVMKRAKRNNEFYIEILDTVETWEEACELEKYYISLIGRRDCGTGTLTNMTPGGDGVHPGNKFGYGRKHTQETKDKLSKIAKERFKDPCQKQKLIEHLKIVHRKNTGRKLSKEHREAISKGNKGKKSSPETIQKYRETRFKNKKGWKKVSCPFGEFESLKLCVEGTNIPNTTIRNRIKSKNFPDWYYVT